MRAVIDTGVFISYLIKGRSVHVWTIHLWLTKQFTLVMSPAIIAELVDVSARPKIANQIEEASRLTLLRRLRQQAIWTPGALDTAGATPDPKDDMLVSAALETEADFIVTWDKALLNMGTYDRVRFVDPESFVNIVQRQGSE